MNFNQSKIADAVAGANKKRSVHPIVDGPEKTKTPDERAAWVQERYQKFQEGLPRLQGTKALDYLQEIANEVFMLCDDLQVYDFPADLHLADVLSKHIGRAVRSR